MKRKGVRKVCSRGHVFYKSSDCPVCPICWPGRAKKMQSDLPKIGAPALRALHNAKIKSLKQLAKYPKAEIAKSHGMGEIGVGPNRKAGAAWLRGGVAQNRSSDLCVTESAHYYSWRAQEK